MDTPTLPEVIAAALDAWQSRIMTAIPARVHAVNAATVDLEPMVQTEADPFPVVPSVPVAWPRTGTAYLVFPIQVGDTGILLAMAADIGQWRRTGERGEPADAALHHVANAVFLPGLSATASDVTIPTGHATLTGRPQLRLGAETADKNVVHQQFLDEFGSGVGSLLATLSGWVTDVNTACGPLGTTVALQNAITTLSVGIAGGLYSSDDVLVSQ